MPIIAPVSGSVITKVSVTNMHAAARALINAQGPNTVARDVFGPQHIPGFVGKRDQVISAGETINTEPADWLETDAWVIAQWQLLPTFLLNGGSINPSHVLWWFQAQVRETTAFWSGGHEAWLCPYAVVDGVNQLSMRNACPIYGEGSTARLQQGVLVVDYIDLTASGTHTITFGALGCTYRSSSGGPPPNVVTAYGSLGFIAFYPS